MSSNQPPSPYTAETPPEVKQAPGLHLITMNTPNGAKVQLLLEELHEAYPQTTKWTTSFVDIATNEQKRDWFLRLNPNGRIPVLVDNGAASATTPPFAVMESSAQLLYLQERLDADGRFWFDDSLHRSEALQWLFFWHGSGAPYLGQANHFGRYAKEKVPYAITRYRDESLRVFGVLEIRLSNKYAVAEQKQQQQQQQQQPEPRDYLAGPGRGKYSVADIGTWPWVRIWKHNTLISDEDMQQFPHLLRWIDRIAERPAAKIATGDKYNLPPKKE